MGDTNVQIGKDPHIDKCGMHNVTNENEKLLTNFGTERNLRIKSRDFHRKEIHIVKEHGGLPMEHTRTQINRSGINRNKMRPDVSSYHFLVGIKMKQSIPKQRNQKSKQVTKVNQNIPTLEQEQRKYYEAEIRKKLTHMEENADIQVIWGKVLKTIRETVNIIRRRPVKRKNVLVWTRM